MSGECSLSAKQFFQRTTDKDSQLLSNQTRLFIYYEICDIIAKLMKKMTHKIKARKISHIFLVVFIITFIIAAGFSIQLALISGKIMATLQKKVEAQENKHYAITISAFDPATIVTPTPYLTPTPTEPWGISRKMDETTWVIKVEDDKTMATSDEIFSALNHYRQKKGVGTLVKDAKLTDFSQKRARQFLKNNELDSHSGFNAHFSDEKHLRDAEFMGVGENSSYGYKLFGVHLVEWIFAGDGPHNDNQLDPSWTHVGIGVAGTGVDIIFGKK